MKIQTSVRMSFTPSNHIGLSPFCTISATCLLFRRSPPLLTELGKDREPTVPTCKPAALRQMVGKVSQPCSPNLFSQQTERAQNRKEGRELKAAAIWEPCSQRARQPPAGCPACRGFCPHGPAALPELGTRTQAARGVQASEVQQERGDALTL